MPKLNLVLQTKSLWLVFGGFIVSRVLWQLVAFVDVLLIIIAHGRTFVHVYTVS